MELVVALVVFGAAFGLGYWQLRHGDSVSMWVVVGLATVAASAGLVLGFLFGAFAVFVIGVIAAAVLVLGYRWYVGRRSGTATAVPAASASAQPEKVCPDCAELVKRDARVCRYCGRRFDEQQDEPELPKVADEPEDRTARDELEPPPAEAVVATSRPAAPATVEAVETAARAAPQVTAVEPAGDTRARFCARCGAAFEADAEFCGTCGAARS